MNQRLLLRMDINQMNSTYNWFWSCFYMVITSFLPVIGDKPRVLILGSMPGKISLEKGQYYAHPRNLFWKILAEIIDIDPAAPYPHRLIQIIDKRIALWDSLQACEREGSSDQNIIKISEIPNEVGKLLAEYPTFQAIAFNGGKSWRVFKERILPGLPQDLIDKLELLRMPSTSPTNAQQPFEIKLEHWRRLALYLV